MPKNNQTTKFLVAGSIGSLPAQLPFLTEKILDEIEEKLLPLQATVNIGTIGHVAHGKTSLVAAISGVKTTKHSAEEKRNITIKLGYANFKIFKCDNKGCLPPACYQSHGSKTSSAVCTICGSTMTLKRHMSFVDCPGHEALMKTMLNGMAVTNVALLIVAANETVPQPQTVEHFVSAQIMDIKNLIVIQNKVDLITPEAARKSYKDIRAFLEGSTVANAPVVPTSCAPNINFNVDVILQYLANIPQAPRDLRAPCLLRVVRSFDVNKPGSDVSSLQGGVCGGSLMRGVIQVGELIEMRPGIIRNHDGVYSCTPVISRVVSLFSEGNKLDMALPGGLIAVGTKLDPVLTKNDAMVGQLLGRMGTLPDVYCSLDLKFSLLKNVVGVKDSESRVTKPKKEEIMMLNVSSANVQSTVSAVDGHKMRMKLSVPVCAVIGEKVSISRLTNKKWRLIGWATILEGKKIELKDV